MLGCDVWDRRFVFPLAALVSIAAQAQQHADHQVPRNADGQLIDEVIVTGESLALLTEMELETEQWLNVAGAGADPLTAVLSLPGVTFTSDHSSEPAVRGSAPDDNGYYVDFIPARYVFHLFGNSIFNHDLIHSFDFTPPLPAASTTTQPAR